MRQLDILLAQLAHHAHAVQPGHLHIQENQVRLELLDQIHGLQAVARRGRNFDVGKVFQQVGELVLASCSSSTISVVRVAVARSCINLLLYQIATAQSFNRSHRRVRHSDCAEITFKIAPADGKLGILIPGMGAVTTTFIAGVEAVKRGLAKPIGSLTQLATVRLGKRTEGRQPADQGFRSAGRLGTIWSSAPGTSSKTTAYEAAKRAGVLEKPLLEQLREPLAAIRRMKAVFDHEYVKRINGPNI